MGKRVLLFNPPVGFFQRGEDRCQANIESSTSGALRACNDLGYMASIFRKYGYEAKIVDYPVEKQEWKNFIEDFKQFIPDVAVMSITTATINEDMEAFKIAKELNPDVITIAKGAHFYGCLPEELNDNIYRVMDYAISGEAEFILDDLIKAIENKASIEYVDGIFYWNKGKTEVFQTACPKFRDDLDSIPFPARDLMNNKLYIRPDTGKPMATISVSRGCPSSCIYCLTPKVSGKKIRKRSPQNVVDEIQECVEKYGIRDFFFKADTFTIDKNWVKELCDEILLRKLKIEWGANSRVRPLEAETLKIMKKAGCWLVAFGIESGSEESLQKMKKGATKEEARQVIKWAKQAGLKVYIYYLVGFPWETREHVKETIEFAKELNGDFMEFHIVVPYEGTDLYESIKGTELLTETIIGHDTYYNPVIRTNFLSTEELVELKNQAIREICLRPGYIFKTLRNIKTLPELWNYTKYGFRMLKNLIIN